MYNLHNHNTFEFICMCKVCEEHLKILLKVYSLLHVAYMCTYHFNYPWNLLVIVWLLLVPTNITGIRGEIRQTVLEGDNLHLTCNVLGRPKPNITWTREKPGNQGNTVVVQEGKVLNITNINRTDAGEYNCSAYNGFGKPEKRTVYVNVTCEYALKKLRCTFHIFSVL